MAVSPLGVWWGRYPSAAFNKVRKHVICVREKVKKEDSFIVRQVVKEKGDTVQQLRILVLLVRDIMAMIWKRIPYSHPPK